MLDALSDLGLFLAPFLIFGLLWLGATRGWGTVAGATLFLLLVAAGVWVVTLRRLPADMTYHPARLIGGRVIAPPRR